MKLAALSIDQIMGRGTRHEQKDAYENLAIAICSRAVADYRFYMRRGVDLYGPEMESIESFFGGQMFSVIMPDLDGKRLIEKVKAVGGFHRTKIGKMRTRSEAELAAERRHRLIEAGLCVTCGRKPHAKGIQKCEECHEKWRASFERSKKKKNDKRRSTGNSELSDGSGGR